ncbi:hypothetical protein [Curtobacterium sp. SORGH_AS_0776]|nr:hypothetical protein [Curtobacterium sp. SORGH_AS_0776]MDR6172147.1 hypothetical protein [Curtobacterium sp. SORGH_AS_0776]
MPFESFAWIEPFTSRTVTRFAIVWPAAKSCVATVASLPAGVTRT